jgi:Zn-dependent metalloprotease
MIEKILDSGDAETRQAALRNLRRSSYIRRLRSETQTRGSQVAAFTDMAVEAHNAQLVRQVFDCEKREIVPGRLVRSEGENPTGDRAVDAAYDGAGDTWTYYKEVHRRNSIDDGGMIVKSNVHYGDRVDNAFWFPSPIKQMVYGDGSGEIFTNLTGSLDVIGHELTHGVIEHEGDWVYEFQSGALNESFADVFGSLVKQYKLKQDAKAADWLIGVEVMVQSGAGQPYALRSLKEPGKAYQNHPKLGDDPQPATMDDYKDLPIWNDNGGVHYNSGIPNHAFYLAAVNFGGYSWEKAGQIWYRAMRSSQLRPTSSAPINFVKAASATIQIAREQFGSDAERIVEKAWKEVKVI